MAEVKGKFIKLAASLMALSEKKNTLKKCDEMLLKKLGKRWYQLESEGWYSTKIFNDFLLHYADALGDKNAIIDIGKEVYPTIKYSVGLPEHIETPLDLIIFEAEGFLLNHKGDDVIPRKFLKKKKGHVIVQAPAPGYDQKLYEGVFLGILEMFNISSGKVKMTKGAPLFEYEITWKKNKA